MEKVGPGCSSSHFCRTLWATPDEVYDEDSEEEDDEPETNFEIVISEMVSTGYAEGHPTDSIALEIKSYKFAQNKVVLVFLLFLII
jgi:hypothetical protein